MREFIPEVQEKLRKRFPRSIERVLPSVSLDPTGGMPRIEQVALFEFQDAEQKSAVILAEGHLSFHSTVYSTYESFQDEFTELVQQIHGIVDLGLLERCGLRYIDAVALRPAETLEQYVRPEMIGLDPALLGSVSSIASESVFRGKTDVGTLIVRFTRTTDVDANDTKFFPPDLQPVSLKYSHRPGESISGVLDFDHFSEMSVIFEPIDAIARLGALHDVIDRAFRSSVQPAAFDLWEREPLV